MRILYIAMDNPAVDTILGGMHDETLAGLPAFYFPFKMLLEKGHTIDLMLISNEVHEVIESEHFKKENFFQVKMKYSGILGMLEFPRLLRRETRKRLKSQHYDFVYGMTEGAHTGVCVADKMGIPCALRQFGTREIVKDLEATKCKLLRWVKAFKNYTYITFALLGRKNFLLTTNDASHSDKLFDLLGIKNQKYDFYFWRTGIKMPFDMPQLVSGKPNGYPETYNPMCLAQIARIADEKRQDRSARIVGELHRHGYEMHMYYVGDISSQKMYESTMQIAEEYGIKDYLHFVGGKPQEQAWLYTRNAFAALLPPKHCLINTFYEDMAQGVATVASDTEEMRRYVKTNENGCLFKTASEAAEQIIWLKSHEEAYWKLRQAAFNTAHEEFLSVEKRFGMEVQLIIDTASGNSSTSYCERI